MMLSLSIWILLYDRLILPSLRRITRKEEPISLLQRVGIGMILAILTMIVSALVENHRRTLAITRPTLGLVPRKGSISSMSGCWLIPQLAIAGISEAFTVIGLIEFYYKQFPENMRSFAGSFVYCASAMASYLSSFLISVVHRTTRVGEAENWLSEDLNKGRLDYFYYMVAGLEVINLGYFLICAKYYKYRTTE
ncbi:NRT1 PTR FAMILY -like [Olea europaea subsp. europaea]|uniref:NRT1 PTR FAMILY -like n=2 Tax=Olea europaea subsp. europaea TaxID=158383 RepID=A0A8S0UCC4_OLEEU|nr:NRT1 PTR FAMILY -like [Olea europaea subsp. europaea]